MSNRSRRWRTLATEFAGIVTIVAVERVGSAAHLRGTARKFLQWRKFANARRSRRRRHHLLTLAPGLMFVVDGKAVTAVLTRSVARAERWLRGHVHRVEHPPFAAQVAVDRLDHPARRPNESVRREVLALRALQRLKVEGHG